jgi:hypothetical protein
MGVFVPEIFAPGSQPGVLVSSSFLLRFSGPSLNGAMCAVAAALLSLSAQGQNAPNHSTVPADYGKLPSAFEANQGQSDPEVKFLAQGRGYGLFLTDRAAELALNKSEDAPSKQNRGKDGRFSCITSRAVKTDVVRMELATYGELLDWPYVCAIPIDGGFFMKTGTALATTRASGPPHCCLTLPPSVHVIEVSP